MAGLTFEQYALAGNATFTLRSHRTGKHLTFTVKRSSTGQSWNVYGPNRERCGWINSALSFRVPQDIDGMLDYSKAFRWAWTYRDSAPHRFDFLPSGKCCRCGRRLTDPASIAAGIGSECLEALENGS